MKKILLLSIFLLSGCMSIDEKGRLEKVRFSVPAFFQVEMDYYKDRENLGREAVRTNTIPRISNQYPKLMEMTPK
jgi:hypothetical protein